jgi:1,4-dihydroxy-2-naphthoate octaprenyltransferase
LLVATKKKQKSAPAHYSHKKKKSAIARAPKVSWLAGARLRTLPLAIAPVAAGAGMAAGAKHFSLTLSLLCLAVAVFLQVGVNFANDYSDGVRGTDAFRVGPARLTGSGSKKPSTVRNVAFAFFALAGIAGIALTVLSAQWWFIAVGAVAILAGWFYTGGKRPYGYSGLGELFVFIFFGLVATVGTVYVQVGAWSNKALIIGAAVGLLACAVLMINNIRDIDTDVHAGKKTLAVRMGRRASVIAFCSMIAIPMGIAGAAGFLYPNALYAQFVWLAVLPAGIIAVTAKTPAEYITVLKITSFTAFAYGVLIGVGFAF